MAQRKVLLVAMSGVRVKSRELLELGMTLPGFVERSKVIASLPSLSLLTLAAHTPEDWDVAYREIDDLGDSAPAEIAAERYDVVAISSFTARVLDAYALADQLRAQGQLVVLGGLHVSALPEEAMQHADAVVQGEGERIWPELLADVAAGSLRRLYTSFGSGDAASLEESRVPRYDLLDISRYNRLTLQTSRGCPLHCSFCAASRTISRYKIKPLALVRRELEAILELWPRPFIELADDNSFVNKRFARELAGLFAEYPVRWFTETDISVADDPELLELLARSGCAQLLIGLESASHPSLKGLDTRDWKYGQFEHYRPKIRTIQSYGISVNGCFILGFDSDESSVFDQTRDFVLESGLSEVQITLLTPFPGTALYRQLRAEGRLLKEVYWDECTLFDVTFRPARMSPDELEAGFHGLMRDLYSDEAAGNGASASAPAADPGSGASPPGRGSNVAARDQFPFFRSLGQVALLGMRVLTFQVRREHLLLLDGRQLAYGLFWVWLVGVGRWWDDPAAHLLQHLGLGSVIYVFVLSFFLWLVILPLGPDDWSYRRVLTFITLTAPPALIYAIPVELMMDVETASVANMWFLAVVAAWRVGLFVFLLSRLARLKPAAIVVGTLLPITLIIVSLTVLNLERAVFEIMGGLRAKTPKDDAYAVMMLLSFLSMYTILPILIGYGFAVAAAVDRRKHEFYMAMRKPSSEERS